MRLNRKSQTIHCDSLDFCMCVSECTTLCVHLAASWRCWCLRALASPSEGCPKPPRCSLTNSSQEKMATIVAIQLKISPPFHSFAMIMDRFFTHADSERKYLCESSLCVRNTDQKVTSSLSMHKQTHAKLHFISHTTYPHLFLLPYSSSLVMHKQTHAKLHFCTNKLYLHLFLLHYLFPRLPLFSPTLSWF